MLAAAPQVHSSASTPPGPHAGAAECEAQERSAECTRAAVAVLFAVASSFPCLRQVKTTPFAGARASRQASSCNDKKTVVFPQRLPVGTDVFAEQLSHGIAQRPAQIAFSSMAEQLWIALFEKRCPRCPSLALADDG